MSMRLSKRYLDRLESYQEWKRCSTPMTNFAATSRAIALPTVQRDMEGPTAEEWMFAFETYGEVGPRCRNVDLLNQYWHGKTNRDWWTKEIGWWNKHSIFVPEEFLRMLTPLCFIELFGREPITELIRFYFDNRYSLIAFNMDNRIKAYLYNNERMAHFQRDDREPWLRVIYRLILIRYI